MAPAAGEAASWERSTPPPQGPCRGHGPRRPGLALLMDRVRVDRRQSQVQGGGQQAALARAPASDLFPPPPPTPILWGACRALGISADTQLGAAAQP